MKKSINSLWTLLVIGCGLLLAACGNDDEGITQEKFQASISGKLFINPIEDGYWLKQTDSGLQKSEEFPSGTGPICTGFFWFIDESTLYTPATLDMSSPMPNTLTARWNRYLNERGERLTLLVKSSYRYDPSTGMLSTDNQSLIREDTGSRYYIEDIQDKEIRIRIDFNEPICELVSRVYFLRENLTPDLQADFPPYKVFASNQEAIAYAEERLLEAQGI